MWIETYKPKKFIEIVGHISIIEGIKKYGWKKPLIFYGPIGVGKTILAEVTAAELGYDLFYVDDSNVKEAQKISEMSSIFGGEKLLVIDNVDKIKDIRTVGDLVKNTKSKLILITSDFDSKRLGTIKRSCEKVQFKKPHPASVSKYLEILLAKNGCTADKEVLKKIATHANGDIRSALNDTETLAKGRKVITEKDLEILEPRNRAVDLYKVLGKIFSSDDLEKVVMSTWDLNEQPRDTIQWIDENIPRVITDRENLDGAFSNLSRADMFLGRIMKRQYWGFLRYVNALMTAGINIYRPAKLGWVQYQFPRYFAKMGQTRRERGLKKSIGEKVGPFLHVSKKIVADQYIPLMKTMIKQKVIDSEEVKERFELTADEIDFLEVDHAD